MDLHEELLKREFYLLESSTRTYGNGKFTGSIVFEKDGTIVDEDTKGGREVFCPFVRPEKENRPNDKFQSIRLRNIEDLDRYLQS